MYCLQLHSKKQVAACLACCSALKVQAVCYFKISVNSTAFQKIALLVAGRTSNPTSQTESVNVLIMCHHADFLYSVIMTPPN
jgi:hypothetical protein